jgi:hypothetical protein
MSLLPTSPLIRRVARILGDRRGFTLEATILLLVMVAGLIAASLLSHVMIQRASGVDYRAARVTHAAEGGADAVMAQLAVAVEDGVVSPSDLAALTAPTIPGTTVTVSASAIGAPVPGTIPNGPYTGLIALNQKIDISVTAMDAMRSRADAIVTVNAQSIPLFQFGVFYEDDLEIHNGPRLDFAGWVHSNSNIYLSSDNQYFADMITTPGSLYWQRKAYNDRRAGVYINNASGVPVRLGFDSRSLPSPSDFVNASNTSFNGRVMTGAHGVRPLRLPLPAGLPAIELISPRHAGDSPEAMAVKFAWKADWHITVDLNNLALGCGGAFANPGVASPAGTFRTGGRSLPDPVADCPVIFRFRPDAFHEGREHIGVDLLEIDLTALNAWVAGDPARRGTQIIFITFINDAPPSGGSPNLNTTRDYPAVRLINGAQLGGPLSLATDRPLYVQGNYNSRVWQPAALLGDAITFLSSSWNDASNGWTAAKNPDGATQAYTMPTAAARDSIYAAIAAGHSATPCDWQVPSCTPTAPPPLVAATTSYGGGLENFPRFLEGWGSTRTMVYRGSLVSLFQSRYATRRRWSWRTYYDPPSRDWQFDLQFRDPNRLPPGTPTVGSVVQIAFRPVY